MLVSAGGGSIFESPLLTKPLEISAGGASHEGVDHFGRNIFQTVADSRYVMLWQWATTQQPPAATTPTVTQPIPTTPTTQAAPGPTVGALRVGDVGSDAAVDSGEERAPEADVDAAVPGGRP
ncbi:MAG TPA: hypothetical protein VFG30_00305 [Polyangiales bacterium]|nr:hypothetical protein [Polyangiales bacterium]